MKVAKEVKKKFKERKGITLIALVITIIVLLILAGISITMLTGDNSILKQGVNAKQKTGEAAEEEQVKIAAMAAVADATANLKSEIEKSQLEAELQKYFSGATVAEEDDSFIFEGEYKTYTISKTGNISSEKSAISINLTLSYENETLIADGAVVKEVTEENIPIPVGFYNVGGTKDTGLVISDVEDDDLDNSKGGNQFVWVPVNQNQKLTLTIETDEEITSIKLTRPDMTEQDITSGGKAQDIVMTYNGIYEVEVTTADETKKIQKRISSLYEKDVEDLIISFVAREFSDFSENYGVTTIDQAKELVRAMLKEAGQSGESMMDEYLNPDQQTDSIDKYGGFYISRFEAGDGNATSERTNTTSDENAVVSKKGAYIYNYVTVTQAMDIAANMYKDSTSINAKTQLITGVGWDRVLNWIIETNNGLGENEVLINSSSWGNYIDSIGDADVDANHGSLQTTGKYDAWKANNIYDLAGNGEEVTSERDSEYGEFSSRGGCYHDNNNSASTYYNEDDTQFNWGHYAFRISLYLQT